MTERRKEGIQPLPTTLRFQHESVYRTRSAANEKDRQKDLLLPAEIYFFLETCGLSLAEPRVSRFSVHCKPPPSHHLQRTHSQSGGNTPPGSPPLGERLGIMLVPQQPQAKYTLLCIPFALKHTWQTCITGWEPRLTAHPLGLQGAAPTGLL